MDLERIDQLAIAACNENSLAGLALGIIKDGQVAYAKGFGTADAARGIAVTPETTFRIGSISKTFTAIGLMQLCEAGRVRLDDPVNSHLKAYKIEQPAGAAPVTLRHLLTHTAGIGELRRLSDLFRPVIGLGCKPGRLPTLREYYAPALRTDSAAGAKWAYANHGFATLGQVIEDVSGQPFVQYMIEKVFAPLGMNHTDCLLNETVRPTLAQGYRMKRRRMTPVPYLEIVPGPAGSVFSSVNEMAKYVTALLESGSNGEVRILKAESLETMMRPQYELDPRMPAMGLGFMIDRLDGHRIVGHNGGWAGFTSAMWLAPDDAVGALALTNTSTLFAPHALAFDLLRVALGLGKIPASRGAILEQPFLWDELCGTYRPQRGWNSNFRIWAGAGGAVKVFVKRGHLMIGTRIPFGALRRGLRLHPADRDDPLLFRAHWDGLEVPILFKRNSSGRIDTVSIALAAGLFATLRKKA